MKMRTGMNMNCESPSRSLALPRIGSLIFMFSKVGIHDCPPRPTCTLYARRSLWHCGSVISASCLDTSVTTTPIAHKTTSKHFSLAPKTAHHQAYLFQCPLFSHSWHSSHCKLPALWVCYDFPTPKSWPVPFPLLHLTLIRSSKPTLYVSSSGSLPRFHFLLCALDPFLLLSPYKM